MEHSEPRPEEPPQAPSNQDSDANAKDEETGGYYGKSKGKGKNHEGCFNCGSKWHMVKDCPLARDGRQNGNDGRQMARAFRKEKEKGNLMEANPKDMAGDRPTSRAKARRERFQGQGL